MSTEGSETPRATGEAAWKAHRDAVEKRNAAAKQAAHEHKSASEIALLGRERRLAQAEEVQLKALNARIARGRNDA